MDALEFALSRLAEAELTAIAKATYSTPPIGPPGLLAWIESVVDLELHRRRGVDLPLREPSEAIPTDEEVPAVRAVLELRDRAADSRVRALYVALLDVLTRGPRH
jgi:hypothetical protein